VRYNGQLQVRKRRGPANSRRNAHLSYVLLFLTTVVPALLSFPLEIKSFCHARWRGHWRSDVPTTRAFACLWTAPNEASRSRRSREAWCLSVTMMLYVLGASMPVFMLALVPGNDFQMLEFLVNQSDP
jgi:hypothetical protein